MLKHEVGRRIKELREARRMEQVELARDAQTSQTTISSIETGTTATNLDLLERILKALDAKPYELIRPPGDSPSPVRRAGDHLSTAHQRMIEIVSHMTDAEVLALLRCWESVAAIMARSEKPK